MLQILKACHMHVTCYSFVHYIAVHACWNYKIQVGAMYKIAPEVCCTVDWWLFAVLATVLVLLINN